MKINRGFGGRALAAKFGRLAALRADESDRLVAVSNQVFRTYKASDTRSAPVEGGILLSGWAARARDLSDGRRQLTELVLPGDVIASARAGNSRLSVLALGDIVVTDASELLEMARDADRWPGISAACTLSDMETDYWLTEQVARVGRLTAAERVASLIQEVHYRLSRAGEAEDDTIPWPLLQHHMGDLLGLSTVHVNRTMKALRDTGAIRQQMRKALSVDLGRLRTIYRFDPPVLPSPREVFSSHTSAHSPDLVHQP